MVRIFLSYLVKNRKTVFNLFHFLDIQESAYNFGSVRDGAHSFSAPDNPFKKPRILKTPAPANTFPGFPGMAPSRPIISEDTESDTESLYVTLNDVSPNGQLSAATPTRSGKKSKKRRVARPSKKS
jgi:hypothetical protein